jgi:hypothetical protein
MLENIPRRLMIAAYKAAGRRPEHPSRSLIFPSADIFLDQIVKSDELFFLFCLPFQKCVHYFSLEHGSSP